MTEDPDARGAVHDELLAALFDRFLEDVLEGREADLEPLLAEHPDLRADIEETWRLARETAGRRPHPRPVIEGYQLIREIGRGGMGIVYLAEHDTLGRQIALKVLPAAASLSPSAKRRFLTEAKALARIESDYVVRIHNIIERDDVLAYEMEWIDGTSFRDLLLRLGEGSNPSITDARKILRATPGALGERSLLLYYVRVGVSIARALAAVHEAGLVHRDVKPSNILIRRDGTALLADFGLVRGTDVTITRTAGFVGTLRYASPEQLREDRDAIDARTDIYSLGVTLWEAVAGRAPFDGNSSVALLRKIESGVAPRLRRVAPHVPRDLETVLTKAMEPNPAARYASAAEFADDLERVLRLEPVRARPVGSLRRSARWARRHRRYGLALATGAAIAVAVLLPGAVEARSRQQREVRAAELQQQARTALLSPIASRRAYSQAVLGQPMQAFRLNLDAPPLEPALRAYDQALELRPDDSALRVERTVVAVAAGSDRTLAGRGDIPSYDLSLLPQLTRKVADQLVRGNLVGSVVSEEIAAATAEDRAVLGLLAYLVGDLALCEEAWHSFDTLDSDQPLVDAGLGILYRVDGRPERAYGRLLRAVRAFPDAHFLLADLAIVALAIGEDSLAKRWAEQFALCADADQDSLDRLDAEFAMTRGEWTDARQHYEAILARDSGMRVTATLRLGEAERLGGDPRAALARFEELVARWPLAARFRLALARAALEIGDRGTYLRQVVWAIAQGYGKGRSPGSLRDVRAILRIGSLRGLYARALSYTGAGPVGDDVQFWPRSPLLTPPFDDVETIERLAETIAGVESGEPGFWLPDVGRATRPVAVGLSLATRTLAWVPMPCLGRWRLPVQAGVFAVAAGWTGLVSRVLPVVMLEPDPTGMERHLVRRFDGQGEGHSVGYLTVVDDVDADGWPEVMLAPILDAPASLSALQLRSARSGDVLWSILRGPELEALGAPLQRVGDVDGDGFDDVAVGGNRMPSSVTNAGAVLLYSGVSGRLLSERYGERSDGRFGSAIEQLGDVDGDGRSDLAIGEAAETAATGRVHIVSEDMRKVIRTIDGPPGGLFGTSLCALGDLDGDGSPELAIGAMSAFQAEGRVYIHSARTGAQLRELTGGESSRLFGMCLALAPDMNGDGTPELLVGAPLTIVGDDRCGAVFVFSPVDGRMLYRVDGERSTDMFGISCCADDFDGDGHVDIAAGSAFAQRNGAKSGEVVIIDGADFAARRVLARFQGDAQGAQLGAIMYSFPDVTGDGAAELIVSAPGARRGAGSVFVLSVRALR